MFSAAGNRRTASISPTRLSLFWRPAILSPPLVIEENQIGQIRDAIGLGLKEAARV
jgi:hypothetical protein